MKRYRVPELMDNPDVDEAAHAHALTALNRTNQLLNFNRDMYQCLCRLGPLNSGSVLDLGAGGGGFLAYLHGLLNLNAAHQAQTTPRDEDLVNGQNSSIQAKQGAPRLFGLDRSNFALSSARRWNGSGIRWICGDATNIPLADASVDVVTCSLLLHHFDEPGAEAILREAARVARRGVVIGDLSRSSLAWAATWTATRMLSRSRIFHVDGPRSVRAAYRREELAELARRAGLAGAMVVQRFPFRLMLTWRRSEATL